MGYSANRERARSSSDHTRAARVFLVLLLALGLREVALAQTEPAAGELVELSVDDLLKVEVTSVARRGQKLSETPAAVFVISSDDIRRSGATTIPELLRMVPGFDVARVDGNVWAASARGFNGRWANKLLVLVDGRSVYSPLFSGVYWDQLDLMFVDIERIEVIRGPGGTLWGANAVNGVINIITKNAVETQGTVVDTTAGTGNVGVTAAARYGGRFGQNGHYRIYGKGFDRPGSPLTNGGRAEDEWSLARGGFRVDWSSGAGAFFVEGDVHDGKTREGTKASENATGQASPGFDNLLRGGHILFRWTATQSKRSETSLQAYYVKTEREKSSLNERLQTVDLDFQHHLTFGMHNATWGASYRSTSDDLMSPSGLIEMTPSQKSTNMATAFIQDEIRMTPKLRITAGSKFEYDSISELQWQPSVRALWLPSSHQAVWAAATRAVRTPSRFELDSRLRLAYVPMRNGKTLLLSLEGDPDLQPERVTSYEIGYRAHPGSRFTVDLTAFHNSMQGIVANYNGAIYVDKDGQTTLPLLFGNALNGYTSGIEAFATFRPLRRWDLTAGYAFLNTDLRYRDDSLAEEIAEMTSPRHQWQLRSFFTVTPQIELDAAFYYVGAREGQGLKSYLRSDVRLSWDPSSPLEISVSGQNLFAAPHLEFNGPAERTTVAPTSRSFVGTIAWRF